VTKIIPTTTLIISSRNRAELLLDTIHSVLEGDQLPAEIVVIDQSDQFNQVLSTFTPPSGSEIHYIWSQSRGSSTGRNVGINSAKNEGILFIDDDMFVDKYWFGTMVHLLCNSKAKTVISGRLVAENGSDASSFSPSLKEEESFTEYEGMIEADVLDSGNMACFRSDILAVGGFDERLGVGTPFPAAEDNDLGFRFLTDGYRILYTPAAWVIHRAWRSQDHYLPHRWGYGLGRGAFYAKHFSRKMIRQRLKKDVINHILTGITTLRVDRLHALGDLALAGRIIVGAIKWRLKYHQS
jgi:GT2 family glycosyltransferase